MTTDRASHHFKQALEGGKWEVLRGFHVFRHSFASNLAAEGTDQRLIDEQSQFTAHFFSCNFASDSLLQCHRTAVTLILGSR